MPANDVNIVISADARNATKNIKKAQKAVGGLDDRIKKFAKRGALAFGAAFTAAGAGAALLVRRSLETIDAQAKMARSLNASVAAVQTLNRASELAGVSFGELRTASVALNRRLSQAANGTGTAVTALDRLGLSAKDVINLEFDQQIALISDRMSELVPQAQRAGELTKLFGDRAAFAISRIDSATIQQANEELRSLGVLVSDVDAAAIEQANDAMSQMTLVSEGLGNRLSVALAPILETLANKFTESAKEGGFLRNRMNELEVVLGGVARIINVVVTAFSGLGKVAVSTITAMLDGVMAAYNGFLGLNQALQSFVIGGEEGVRLAEAASRSFEEMRYRFEGMAAPINAFGMAILNTAKAWNEYKEGAENASTTLRKLNEATTTTGTSLGGVSDKVTETAGIIKNELSPEMKQLESASESVANSFSRSFMGVIDGTMSVKDAFKSMALSIINDLYRIFVVKQITGFISKAIGGMFGDGQPSVGGGFNSPVAGLTLPTANGGGYTGNGARAGGLDGKGGRMAIIHPRETILDHTKGQGQGVTVVQNINVSAGVAQTVRAEMTTMLPQIGEYAKAAVLDARKRGGAYGGAFA
tara:strand:+ start:3167 stop:4936 length:1770 start_codon:yes stop_codon:yes gene_type:complete